MAVSGAAILEMMGKADDEVRDQLRTRMVEVLAAGNEDPAGFSVTSPFNVATMRRVPR
jgi:hypothetical protein